MSKDVIGSDIPNYRYIIVIGSQDGLARKVARRDGRACNLDAWGRANPAT